MEEDVNMGTAIIPNLDSIAEFRILTNNFDAEYGEYSGGQINVVTKAGTNAFHGDVFEFLRNTDLDARNYFSPTRGTFLQNQFGATFGGPIVRNKIFFFADYQGTRQAQGVDTGLIPVPSLQDRSGNLADSTALFVTTNSAGESVPTTVSGTLLGEPTFTEARLSGNNRRGILRSGLHQFEPVRASECDHSQECVVGARATSLAIHSDAECRCESVRNLSFQ